MCWGRKAAATDAKMASSAASTPAVGAQEETATYRAAKEPILSRSVNSGLSMTGRRGTILTSGESISPSTVVQKKTLLGQ